VVIVNGSVQADEQMYWYAGYLALATSPE